MIFTSYMGPWINFSKHACSACGFREEKGTSFVVSLRVPCIVRWKRTIQGGQIIKKLFYLTQSQHHHPVMWNFTCKIIGIYS
jgi:hypothetical protein